MSPLISRQVQRDGGGIYGVHRFAEFFAGKPSSQQGAYSLYRAWLAEHKSVKFVTMAVPS